MKDRVSIIIYIYIYIKLVFKFDTFPSLIYLKNSKEIVSIEDKEK